MKRSVSDDEQSRRREGRSLPSDPSRQGKRPKDTDENGVDSDTGSGRINGKQSHSVRGGTVSKSDGKLSVKAPEAPGGTYLNPANFAERLMHVLENDIASDCIWFLGDGEALAIHPEKLRRNAVLTSHFQGNRYSSFVRNLNRWGFRRVSYYSLPETCTAFHNSLFQKQNPHLVKHMKMDSDVQDIFARHQMNNDMQHSSGTKAAAALSPTGGGVDQQEAMQSLLALHQQQQNNHKPNQGEAQQPGQPEEASVIQERVAAMLRERLMQQGQVPASVGTGAAAVNPTVQQENYHPQQSREQQNENNAPDVKGSNESGIALLEQLMQLSQRYLSQYGHSNASAEVATIQTLLRLLILLAQQEIHHQQQQRTTQHTVQELLALLIQQQQQQQQQQHLPPQVQRPIPQIPQQQNPDLLQQLMQQPGQIPQQPMQQQSQMLLQLLAQQQQQQPPHQQQQDTNN